MASSTEKKDVAVASGSDVHGQSLSTPTETITPSRLENIGTGYTDDPYDLRPLKREEEEIQVPLKDWLRKKNKQRRLVQEYYAKQNALIDAYLGSANEEQAQIEDTLQYGGKVKFAANASTAVNFCLFGIQLYAAITTGSLALFATAADAFMDLVSSIVIQITSRLAATPNLRKFPVGRKRIETVGIILFCCLMTTVSVELIIESATSLSDGKPAEKTLEIVPLVCVGVAIAAKGVMFVYCFILRRYPIAHLFMLDHRNDIAVNSFGLVMSIVGTLYSNVWWLDPGGAIAIACLILLSWGSTAFEHMWLLVGRSAPDEFLNKLVYVAITHDSRIQKIDTARAYTAGEKFYVEVDIIMSQDESLKVTHDVSQTLQRKLEGLADVERAFVHVDYEDSHDIGEEHKPLYEISGPTLPITDRIRELFKRSSQESA